MESMVDQSLRLLRASTATTGRLKSSLICPRTRPVSDRTGERRKKVTQPDPSYLPYMSGMSANPHIHLKYGEDMRARGHARVRPVNPPRRTRPHPGPPFLFLYSFIFFLSLHLHESRASDRTYEEENEDCGCADGQIGAQNGHARSLTGRVRGRLRGRIRGTWLKMLSGDATAAGDRRI